MYLSGVAVVNRSISYVSCMHTFVEIPTLGRFSYRNVPIIISKECSNEQLTEFNCEWDPLIIICTQHRTQHLDTTQTKTALSGSGCNGLRAMGSRSTYTNFLHPNEVEDGGIYAFAQEIDSDGMSMPHHSWSCLRSQHITSSDSAARHGRWACCLHCRWLL